MDTLTLQGGTEGVTRLGGQRSCAWSRGHRTPGGARDLSCWGHASDEGRPVNPVQGTKPELKKGGVRGGRRLELWGVGTQGLRLRDHYV